MKVYLQAKDDSVTINGDITVTVLKIDGDEVLLGIDAPEWLAIEQMPRVAIGDCRGRCLAAEVTLRLPAIGSVFSRTFSPSFPARYSRRGETLSAWPACFSVLFGA